MILESAIVMDMTTTASLTDLTPIEIDTALYPLLAERYALAERRVELRKSIAKTVWPVEYKERYERYDAYGARKAYALNTRRVQVEDRTYPSDLDKAVEKLAGLDAEIDRVNAEIAPYDAEYDRRGGWSRYIIVPDGHIHHHGCGSLRPTTQRLILIDASGSDAEEVVRVYNYVACTKCFPNAPVAPVKVDPSYCTAGPYDYTKASPQSRYAACKGCGYIGAVSSLGKLRKHKKEVVKK